MSYPTSSTKAYHNHVRAAADTLLDLVGPAPVAVVLGSGLNGFVKNLRDTRECHYSKVPYLPQTSVSGHDGKCVTGTLDGADGDVRVMCFAGRVHMYEGWRPFEINFMSRLCFEAGVKLFILTNSAGGCLKGMTPGSIMMIRDHMRFTNMNPLLDVCEDSRFGPRVTGCANGIFSDHVADLARQAAAAEDIKLDEGTYCWTSGPCYESLSEVQAGIKLSAGAFGMSTVPEILSAHAIGMELFGISLATNLAAGLMDEKLLHSDVKRVAAEAGPKFERLMLAIIKRLSVADIERLAAAKRKLRDEATAQQVAATGFWPVEPRAAWTLTKQQVTDAADAIREANMSGQAPTAAVVLAEGHDAWVNQLTNTRHLSLADIPALRENAASASGRNGALVIGTTASGVRVIAVASQFIEGLPGDEASLLAQAFAAVGVRTVAATLCGTNPNSAAHEPEEAGKPAPQVAQRVSFVVLDDAIDRSKNAIAPIVDSALVGSRVDNAAAFHKELRQAGVDALKAANGDADVTVGAYMHIPGPVLPTKAETRSARIAQCAATVGVTSPAILAAARAAGLNTFAVAVTLDVFADAADIAKQVTEALPVAGASVDAVLAAASKLGAKDDTEQKQPTPQERAEPWLDGPVAPLRGSGGVDSQEPLEHAKAVAEFLSTELKFKAGDVAAAVFSEGALGVGVGSKSFKPSASVSGAAVPHFANGDWELSVGDWAGKRVLFVSNSSHSAEYVEQHGTLRGGLGLIVRALQQLNVANVLAATPVSAATDEHKVGDVVVLRDHVNLTGHHPLFGPNVDEYGTRFPDMSNVYDKAFRQVVADAAPSGVVANVNNAALDSAAEARFVSGLGCSLLSSGEAVSLVLVANHMEMHTLVVAAVNQASTDRDALRRPVEVTPAQVDKVAELFTKCLASIQ